MLPKHAGWPLPYFQIKAVRAGFEPAHFPFNRRAPYQLGYRTTNSRRLRSSPTALRANCALRRRSGGRRNRTAVYRLMRSALCRLSYSAKKARGENRTHASALPKLCAGLLRFAGVDGPRGSRTHYPSIKSRELIQMSFRPNLLASIAPRRVLAYSRMTLVRFELTLCGL